MKEDIRPGSASFLRHLAPWWDYRRKRFWLLVTLVVYTLVGFLLVPWLARDALVDRLQKQLGVPVALAELRLNPWSLTVEAEGFAITAAGGDERLGFERLFANLQLSSLFRRALVLREVTLDAPYVKLVRLADGSLNLTRLLDALGPNEAEEAPAVADGAAEETPFRFLIGELAINGGEVDVRDETRPTAFETKVAPIDVRVFDLTTLPDNTGRQHVSVSAPGGTRLEWNGTLQLTPLASQGQVSLEGPYLALGHEYVQDLLEFTVQRGEVSGTFDYALHAEPAGGVRASVNNLHWEWTDIELETVGTSGESERFLRVPSLIVAGGSLEWPARAANVDSLTISGVELSLWRVADGGLSLLELLTETGDGDTAEVGQPVPETPAASAPETGLDTGGWSAGLGLLRVEGLNADFEDRTGSEPAGVGVRNLTLEIRDITTEPGARFPLVAGVELASGGRLDLSGTLGVLPDLALQSELNLSDLDLTVAQPWIARVARLDLDSGALDARLQITADAADPFMVSGSLEVPDVVVIDTRSGERLFGWQQLGVDQLAFSAADNHLELSELALTSPYGRLRIAEDQTTNYSGLLVEPAPAVTAPSAAEAAPEASADTAAATPPEPEAEGGASALAITVGKVRVIEGSADYADLSLPLPFRTAIRELGGEISTISTRSTQPARVDLRGRVGEYGLAEISGALQPMDPAATTDMRVLFRNVSLPTLTPYTMRFAGRKIDSGTLELDLHYVVDAGRLQGDNGILIDELVLGEKVEHPDAMDLPLGLAVALLKGPDGSIDIDLAVSGDVGDPEFGIGKVILRAFANLITRVVSAPFNLLARLVGAEGEDFGHIEFRPGEASLAPPEQEKLQKLALALQQRPTLGLSLRGVTVPEADSAALQQQRIEAAVQVQLAEQPASDGAMLVARRRAALESLLQQRLGVDPATVELDYQRPVDPMQPEGDTALDEPAYLAGLERLLAQAETVTDADLAELAGRRAAAVRDALLETGTVEPARLSVAEPDKAELESGWIPMPLEVEQVRSAAGAAADDA